jgi:hypothetical protein
MTTALEAFEKWMKEKIEFNQYDDLGRALQLAQNKLEWLKEKYNIGSV